MAGSATAAAQSRTAKLPHTKQPNQLKSLKGARSHHPASGSIDRGDYSRLFVALAMDWFKCDWEEDRKGTQINQVVMVGSNGELSVHCPVLLPFGSS
jgi:hypothetical protein